MKVELARRFLLPGSVESAWAVLSDLEAAAGCLPGLRLTERIDASHWRAALDLRVGAQALPLRGEIEVHQLDVGQARLQLVGQAAAPGAFAAFDLVARIEAAAHGASVLVAGGDVVLGGGAASWRSGALADAWPRAFGAAFAARVSEAETRQALAFTPTGISTAAPERVAVTAHPVAADSASRRWRWRMRRGADVQR